MKRLLLLTIFIGIFFTGCTKYNDPEVAQRIAELEAKDHLDEFDKEELKDLKEQGKYAPQPIKACKTN